MVGLCRLCASLRKADVLITIKDDNSEICEKLRHCCQLNITIEDPLPKSICQDCIKHLNLSHRFYLKVKEAQETLQTLYPSLNEDLQKVTVESHTSTLVRNLSDASKDRKRTKSSLEQKDQANNKSSDLQHVKVIKLENSDIEAVNGCLITDSDMEPSHKSPSKKQDSEALNCLDEVYNMLEMTREDIVLENSYEVLEPLDEANDLGELVADGESAIAKYEDYENVEVQEQLVEVADNLLGDDCSEKFQGLSQNRKSLIQHLNGLKELNVEVEYIEADEYDEEISFSKCDEEKLCAFKTLQAETCLQPKFQFKSWKSYSYLCYLCDLKTPSFIDLKKHISVEHKITQNENIKYKCYDCQKIIPRYNFFLNHIRLKHHPTLKLRCEACDLSCQDFEELSHHRRLNCAAAKNYESLLPCNQCFKSFYNTLSLQNHIKSQHTVAMLQVQFQCVQCGKQFQNKNTFKAHERLHADGNSFVCEICQKTYTSKLSLEQHLLVHADDKMYKCNICDKSFKTFVTLDQHRSIHNDEKPFKCDFCGKNFRKKIEKVSHERVHTGEMPFKCGQCDKRFRFRSAFNAHMKIHTGIKPYSCEYCDKTFAESSNRNKHVRRIHLSGDKKRKHKCKN